MLALSVFEVLKVSGMKIDKNCWARSGPIKHFRSFYQGENEISSLDITVIDQWSKSL